MNFLKSKSFITFAVTLLSTIVLLGVLGYIFIPRVGNNALIPVTLEKIEKYDVSVHNGMRVVSETVVKAALSRSDEKNIDFQRKYQDLVDMDGIFIMLTDIEIMELLNSGGSDDVIDQTWSQLGSVMLKIDHFGIDGTFSFEPIYQSEVTMVKE